MAERPSCKRRIVKRVALTVIAAVVLAAIFVKDVSTLSAQPAWQRRTGIQITCRGGLSVEMYLDRRRRSLGASCLYHVNDDQTTTLASVSLGGDTGIMVQTSRNTMWGYQRVFW